jgi:adenylosuccinate lyase
MPNLILPGNPRYQPKQLIDYFGYDNLYRCVAEVELANLEALMEIGVIPPDDFKLLTEEIKEKILGLPTTDVDRVEREITKHDIRAWVRLAQELLPAPLKRWVHVPLTSYDPLDTGRSLQFTRTHYKVVRLSVRDVLRDMKDVVKKYAGLVQIGRTHGQHALPITVGFWLATVMARILYNAKKMDEFAGHLVGKISGAVGAHNAQFGLGFDRKSSGRMSFEDQVLLNVGLQPAMISTQILPPEPLAYYLFSCVSMSAALAQLGRDCRQLMRSEIGEITEAFESGQVGSSTMAHKRNPINFENLEGMYLRTKNEFGKVLDTMISEHQRDLVGSSVYRDFPIIVVNLTQQLNTLLKLDKAGNSFIKRISVNEGALKRNFGMNAHLILAEPVYIALQMAGYEGDAHELVNRKAVPQSQITGRPLADIIDEMSAIDEALDKALQNIPPDFRHLLHTPEAYLGDAEQKALEVVAEVDNYLTR